MELCKSELSGTNIKICSVVGFPLGAMHSEAKVFETKIAISNGADEIDMVMNVGWFKSGKLDLVSKDIEMVVDSALKTNSNSLVKVILETGLLSEDEVFQATVLVAKSGAHFVKTSTGFGPRGASFKDIEIMKAALKEFPSMKIKAAGGIKSREEAEKFVQLGVHRLGTSRGVQLVQDQKSKDISNY